tara:strand:- start:326 stop:973 length:648 start_codon:yes stop_codon:yes gene_type:complete
MKSNKPYLQNSYYFDFESDIIQDLIAKYNTDSLSLKEKAIGIYTKIRDGLKYDSYSISLSKVNFRASSIAAKNSGNCVEKSILLIACLRALNIPARLHLGKVKNHLAVEKLVEKFGSNELTPHGMVNVFINNEWLKMSPAFNTTLCEKFNVAPLDFDGENSSYLQQFTSDGNRFMEYTDDYGYFEDVPLAFMENKLKEHYPHIFVTANDVTEFKL